MTTVSGPVSDTLLDADGDYWTFASHIRTHGTGVITEKPRTIKPAGGILTVDLPPGPVRITTGRHSFDALVPVEDCTLAQLVAASLAYPPNTPQAMLDSAVGVYVETNRKQFKTRAVPVTAGPNAGKAQWVDANDQPVGDPVPWDQVISEAVVSAAAVGVTEALAPAIVTAGIEARGESVIPGDTPGTVRKTWGDAVSDEFPAVVGLWDGIAGKPADYYHASLVADRTGASDATTELAGLLSDASAAGGGTVYFDGTFVTDPLVIPANVRVLLDDRAVIKLKDNATAVSGKLAPLIIGGSNVSVVGGVIDGNRAGQSKSAYNALGGSPAQATGGVLAISSQGSPLTGLDIDTTIVNAVDYGLRCTWVNDSTFDVRILDSGCGASFSNCDNLTGQGLAFTRIDGSGWKLFPHVLDFTNVTQVRFDLVTSAYHTGTGQVGDGTSLSNWISGATFINTSDIAIGTMALNTTVTANQAKGVGASFLSCANLRFGNLRIAGYSDCLLEMGGVVDSQINTIDLDGRWQTSDFGSVAGVGWKLANYGFYPGLSSRSQRFTERNTFGNLNIRRCFGVGIHLTGARRNTFMGGRVYGCRFGVRANWVPTDSSDNFTDQLKRDLDGNKWIAVDCSYNEEHGWDIRDGANTLHHGCRASNNGQAVTRGAARGGGTVATTPSGIYFGTSSATGLSKTGEVLIATEATDTQSFNDALSAVSGKTLSALDPEKYVPGQTIKLVGAGVAGADLITRVQDVWLDEITIEDAPSTWPTVAGTGTISSSGTAITGAGTAFATELNARYFITAAGQTRQIIKTANNTQATVASAFSPALPAGTSFTISKIFVNGMPSQSHGLYFSVDTLAPQVISGYLEGNVTSRISDNTPVGTNKMRATSVPGMATAFLNTLSSDAFVRAYENGGAASRTMLGQVGPSNQGGLGMGATGTGSGADVALYRHAANTLRTENVFVLGNQASTPAAPLNGGVLYVEGGALKYKGSSGTITTLGPA